MPASTSRIAAASRVAAALAPAPQSVAGPRGRPFAFTALPGADAAAGLVTTFPASFMARLLPPRRTPRPAAAARRPTATCPAPVLLLPTHHSQCLPDTPARVVTWVCHSRTSHPRPLSPPGREERQAPPGRSPAASPPARSESPAPLRRVV